MADVTVYYQTYQDLCCGTLPTDIIVCLPTDLVAPTACPMQEGYDETYERSYVEGTLTGKSFSCNGCSTLFSYTITIDEAYIAEGETVSGSDILGVFCTSCYTGWVQDLVGDEISVSVDGDQVTVVTQHGCEYTFALSGVLTVEDTSSVDLTLAADVLSAAVNISASANNQLTIQSDGLDVRPVAVTDSSSIDFTLTPGSGSQTLTGTVKVSASSNNQITTQADGLDVRPVAVTDTSTIDFTLTPASGSQTLTGSVKVSADANNNISAHADGIYAPSVSTLAWTDWVPTFGGTGSMTYTSTTLRYARYLQIGKVVYVQIGVTGTVGGTPDTGLTFTLPINSVAAATSKFGHAFINNGGYAVGHILVPTASATAQAIKADLTAWSAGASREFYSNFFYEVS